jgi:hypothetical protein
VNVTGSIGILPNATNFSHSVSSFSSVLACCNRTVYPLGTATSSSALTARATFLADADIGAPKAIRWQSRLGSGPTGTSAFPGYDVPTIDYEKLVALGILPVHSTNRQDACSPSFLRADDERFRNRLLHPIKRLEYAYLSAILVCPLIQMAL